jgi:hypothetical protein
MNPNLQTLTDLIQRAEHLSAEEKAALLKEAKAADKKLEITTFKLDRTEKVKHTAEVLLEETIEELEQKRKAVEAQNRELEIEAALERVRTRTMAMFKSDELREVVFEFFKQMNPLGFAQWGCIIALADEERGGFMEWLSPPTDRVLPECYYVPKLDHPAFEKLWSAYVNQVPSLTFELEGLEKQDWDRLFFENTDFKKMPQSVTDAIFAEPKVSFSFVPMKYGGITAVDIGPIPGEMIRILIRFAKVFEQTYTRFLDLQKAEAQARESQIQLALERARTQSMIMQHSTELDDTLRVFHEQVLQLGIPSAFSFLWLPDEEKDRHIFWAAWAENSETVFKSKAVNYPLDRNEPATMPGRLEK